MAPKMHKKQQGKIFKPYATRCKLFKFSGLSRGTVAAATEGQF